MTLAFTATGLLSHCVTIVQPCTEETLREIKSSADPLRHGEASGVNAEDRAKLFMGRR